MVVAEAPGQTQARRRRGDQERPALPPHLLVRYAAELQAFLRREVDQEPDGTAAGEYDGYAPDTSLRGAGGPPRGSYIAPAAYTRRVERRVDQQRYEQQRWRYTVEGDRQRWGRWREALDALNNHDEEQAIWYRYVEGLTQAKAGEVLHRSESWVQRQEHAGLRHLVLWFVAAGTLDEYCVGGRWR